MARHVVESVRARGSLALDPKHAEGASFPERFCAWDEDRTTLAIDAASHLPRAPVAFVGPGIDLDALRVALDIAVVHHASDPMSVAKSVHGPALAIGCPDDHTAIAALVDDGAGTDPAAPRDVSAAPRLVSAHRALQESGRVEPEEAMPDTPMGAYVPWGTWNEDLPARLRLVAQRCDACSRVLYPPRAACPACRGMAFSPLTLPREARVYAATRIGRGGAPSEFALEQAQVGAFWVAVVEWEGPALASAGGPHETSRGRSLGDVEWPEQHVRITARLSGFEDEPAAIGAPVRAIVRRLFTQEGKARYGAKFGRV